MRTFTRIIVCTIVAAICGGLFLAILGGASGLINRVGRPNDQVGWAFFFAFLGGIMGAVPGGIIGLVVGSIRPRWWLGALIGTALASLFDVYILSQGGRLDWQLLLWPPVMGALVGLIAAFVARAFRTPAHLERASAPGVG
jgi:hypothetical protein